MKKNMGVLDRAIRVVLVLVIVILYVAGAVSGLAAVILGIIALVFLGTGIIGSCPGYLPFNISTMPKKIRLVTCGFAPGIAYRGVVSTAADSRVHLLKSMIFPQPAHVWLRLNSSEKISFSLPHSGHLQMKELRFLNS